MPNRIDLAGVARPTCGRSGKAATFGWLSTSLMTLLMLVVSAFVIGPVLAADIDDAVDNMQLHRYWDVLDEYKAKGYQPVENVSVTIPITEYSAAGPAAELKAITNLDGRTGKFLQWTADADKSEQAWVEWKVKIPVTGLYNLGTDYYPMKGTRSAIQRALTIDGVTPFYENKLQFTRIWENQWPALEPGEKTPSGRHQDGNGDDVRPKQVEAPAWRHFVFRDIEAIYEWPLQLYFTAGEHTIRLSYLREPVVLGDLTVMAPEKTPTYADVEKVYKANGYKPVKNQSFTVQAEDTYVKSDATMRPEYGGDALNSPRGNGHLILNEFGSWNWRNGGQWASWKINVPETGLYQIGMREWNGWDQKPSMRSLKIDSALPFAECNELKVPYEAKHQNLFIPSAADGKPYLFYLTKGTHVLEMEVRIGPFRDTLRTLYYVAQQMGRIARKIVLVTGPNPDPNTDWELDKTIPNLVPDLVKLAGMLDAQVTNLTKICGKRPFAANSLAMVADQLRSMAKDPTSIAGRFDQFSTSQSSLSTWLENLRFHPLVMDWIWGAGPDDKKPRAVPTVWERTKVTMQSFLISFSKDYTGVGTHHVVKGKHDKVINVWIGRGREWAEILKNMSEDDFTPQTGIKVNINILPVGDTQTMLLSSISGRSPDVALGVPGTIPVDFAIRGALEKLNQFPDYKEVAKRFRPGALVPFNYQGGNWAIPEDQDFIMMYYRTDVMQQLGITQVPQTWDDVYKILPILQQAGLAFYFPQGLFTPFLFQRGGNYYTKDGLRSALDDPRALKAFEEWTDLYTKYKLQKQANFFNRMRTGEMPIGVEGYGFYLTLTTAAPELTGWWEMVPLPGHLRADGTIDRSVGGLSNTAVMFKNPASKANPERKKWSWEFIKWWTSTDSQVRFGSELESLLGSGAMWNTANVEALMSLPWPAEHRRAIKEQWQWFREAPYTVGGYFTLRHVANAWNRVVLSGMNPREALELSVDDINKELEAKQEEFHIKPPKGEAAHPNAE